MQVQQITPSYEPYSALPIPSLLALNSQKKPQESPNLSTITPEENFSFNPQPYHCQSSFAPLEQTESSTFLIPQNKDFPFNQSMNYSYQPQNNHLFSPNNRSSKQSASPSAFDSCENNISSVPNQEQFFNFTTPSSSLKQEKDQEEKYYGIKEIKQPPELLYANDLSSRSMGQIDNTQSRVDSIIEKAQLKIDSQHHNLLMTSSVVESVKRYLPEYVSYAQGNSPSMLKDSYQSPELSPMRVFTNHNGLAMSAMHFSGKYLDLSTPTDILNTQVISSTRQAVDVGQTQPDKQGLTYSMKYPSFSYSRKNGINPEKTPLDISIPQNMLQRKDYSQPLERNLDKPRNDYLGTYAVPQFTFAENTIGNTQHSGVLDFIINDELTSSSGDKLIIVNKTNKASFHCNNQVSKLQKDEDDDDILEIDGNNDFCSSRNLFGQGLQSSGFKSPLNLAASQHENYRFEGEWRNDLKDSQEIKKPVILQPLNIDKNVLAQRNSSFSQIIDKQLSLIPPESQNQQDQEFLLKQQELIRIAEAQIDSAISSCFTCMQGEIKETQVKEEGQQQLLINSVLEKQDQHYTQRLEQAEKELTSQLQNQQNSNSSEKRERQTAEKSITRSNNALKSKEKDNTLRDQESDESERIITSELNNWLDPAFQNFIKKNFSRQQKQEFIEKFSRQIQSDCEDDSAGSVIELQQDCLKSKQQEMHVKNSQNSKNILEPSEADVQEEKVNMKEIKTEVKQLECIQFSENCKMELQNKKERKINAEKIMKNRDEKSQEIETNGNELADEQNKQNYTILDENTGVNVECKLLLEDIFDDVQHALKKYDQIISESVKNKISSSQICQGIGSKSNSINDCTLKKNKAYLFHSLVPSQTEISIEKQQSLQKNLPRSNSMKNILEHNSINAYKNSNSGTASNRNSVYEDNLIIKMNSTSLERSPEQGQKLNNFKMSTMVEQDAENAFQHRRQQIFQSLQNSTKLRRVQHFLSQKPMNHSSNKIIGLTPRQRVRTSSSNVSLKSALGFSGQLQETTFVNGSGILSSKVKASVQLDKVLSPKGKHQSDKQTNDEIVDERLIPEQQQSLQKEKKKRENQQRKKKVITEFKEELLPQQNSVEDPSSPQQYSSVLDAKKLKEPNEMNCNKRGKIISVLQVDIQQKETKGEVVQEKEIRIQKDQEKEETNDGKIQIFKKEHNEPIQRERKGIEEKRKNEQVLKQGSFSKKEKQITYLRQTSADNDPIKAFENQEQQLNINKTKQTSEIYLTEHLDSQESIFEGHTWKSTGDIINHSLSQISKSEEGQENNILKANPLPLSVGVQSKEIDSTFHLKRLAILNDIEDLNRQIEMERSSAKRDQCGIILEDSKNNMQTNNEQIYAKQNNISSDSLLLLPGDSVESKDIGSLTEGTERDENNIPKIEKITGNSKLGLEKIIEKKQQTKSKKASKEVQDAKLFSSRKRINEAQRTQQFIAETTNYSAPSIPLEQMTQERDLRVQQIRGKSLQKVEGGLVKEKRGKSAAMERAYEHVCDEENEKEEKQRIEVLQATISKGNKTLACFEKRNEQWIQARKNRMEKTAKTLTNQQMKECTFKPQTNQFYQQQKSQTSRIIKAQHKPNYSNHKDNQSQNYNLLAKLSMINNRLLSQKLISSQQQQQHQQLQTSQPYNLPVEGSPQQQGKQSPIMQRFSEVEFWSQSDASVFKVMTDLDISIQQELKKEINEVLDIIQGLAEPQENAGNKPLGESKTDSKEGISLDNNNLDQLKQ